MLASRTIMSAGCGLPAATQILELGHEFFFVNVGECLSETIRCGLKLGELGCFRVLSGVSRD
jgi:hypothetical protein